MSLRARGKFPVQGELPSSAATEASRFEGRELSVRPRPRNTGDSVARSSCKCSINDALLPAWAHLGQILGTRGWKTLRTFDK